MGKKTNCSWFKRKIAAYQNKKDKLHDDCAPLSDPNKGIAGNVLADLKESIKITFKHFSLLSYNDAAKILKPFQFLSEKGWRVDPLIVSDSSVYDLRDQFKSQMSTMLKIKEKFKELEPSLKQVNACDEAFEQLIVTTGRVIYFSNQK